MRINCTTKHKVTIMFPPAYVHCMLSLQAFTNKKDNMREFTESENENDRINQLYSPRNRPQSKTFLHCILAFSFIG